MIEDIRESPTDLIRRLKEAKPLIDPFSFPEMKAYLAPHVFQISKTGG